MLKKSLVALLTVFALTTTAYADFSIGINENGVDVEGTCSSDSGSVTLSIYDNNNDLLYAEQKDLQSTSEFSFKASVPASEKLKVKVGSSEMYSPDMLISDAIPDYNIIYVSQYAAEGGNGTQSAPYRTLSAAYAAAAAGDVIKIVDRISWDISSTFSKKVTITNGELVVNSAFSSINAPITIKDCKVITDSVSTIFAADLTIGEGVTFTTAIDFNVTRAVLHSGNYAAISGTELHLYKGISSIGTINTTAAIFEEGSVYGNFGSGCAWKIYCSTGGSASLESGNIIMRPYDDRLVSINGGTYAKECKLTSAGEYNAVFNYDFKMHKAELSQSANAALLKIDLSVYNRTGDPSKNNPLLIAAVYGQDNLLKEANYTQLTIGDMLHKEIAIGAVQGTSTIKLFIWDSFSELQPLCSMVTDIRSENTEEKDYFVSPSGDDTAAGTMGKPFATLSGALAAAKGQALPVVIYLREGKYPIASQIAMDSAYDKITVKPYNNEKAVITTGYDISGSSFFAASDTISQRVINSAAKAGLKSVSLSDQGITDVGEIIEYAKNSETSVMPVLSQDNKTMKLAAYPDSGYVTFGSNVSGGDGSSAMSFYVPKTSIPNASAWSAGSIYADGYITQDWNDSRCKVTLASSGSNYKVTAQDPSLLIAPKASRRVRFLNVPEEISSRGEWYLDRSTDKLYMYPYDGFGDNSTITFNPRKTLKSLFSIDGSSFIKFENINFEHIGTEIFNIKNSNNINVENCEITDVLGTVLESADSSEIIITGNKVHDISGKGFILDDGNAATLNKSNDYVSDNEIYRFSQDARCYNPALSIQGYGVTVRRNKIYDSPHLAIELAGMGFDIEYNEIYDVCNETADSGAIYGGQFPQLRENVMRYNYFHDIRNSTGVSGSYRVNTVYFDDLWSACDVCSNIFSDVENGVFIGGGRSNTVKNNIFIDCNNSICIDSRGTTYSSFESTQAYANLYYSPYQTELWHKEFPDVYNLLNDEPLLPKYNKFIGNVYINSSPISFSGVSENYVTNTGNITVSSSAAAFKDYGNKIFDLMPTSTIYSQISGFDAPDFGSIGILRQ